MTRLALVTGGAGFIGSNLVRRLIDDGVKVRVLDNFSSGMRANLDGLNVEIVEGDVRDAGIVEAACIGVKHVYHLAAMVSVTESNRLPLECYAVNLQGSLHVLDAARNAQAKSAILISSCALYGRTKGPTTETTPASPGSPYAASKLAMEQAGSLYAERYALPVVSLRLFNVYGPRQSAKSDYAAVIPAFLRSYLSNESPMIDGAGDQKRDFVFVDDVLNAIVRAGGYDEQVGQVFNVGSGQSVSILQLAKEIQSILRIDRELRFGPSRPGDINFSEADLSLIEQSLGYRPSVSLAEGLKTTVKWMRSIQKAQQS